MFVYWGKNAGYQLIKKYWKVIFDDHDENTFKKFPICNKTSNKDDEIV